MKQEFWQERWSANRIGFHQSEINHWLQTYHEKFAPSSGRVLVPLSGKSKDMLWLAQQGHEVVGVEFVAKAVAEFFEDNQIEARAERRGTHEVRTGGNVSLWNSDFFAVTHEQAGRFPSIFDRAAMIALPPETRVRYAEHIVSLMEPEGRALIVTLAYDQSILDGPPFSVSQEEVRDHLAGHGSLEVLHCAQTDTIPPRFKEVGLPTVEQTVWLFTRSAK